MDNEELLTTQELCKWLQIGRVTAWRWRQQGMPYLGERKSLRYRKRDILKWLEKKGGGGNDGKE